MTLREFESLERSVQSELFIDSCSDLIIYNIDKAAFEQRQFKRLLAAALQVEADKETSLALLKEWTCKLENSVRTQVYLEKLQDQLRPRPRPYFSPLLYRQSSPGGAFKFPRDY